MSAAISDQDLARLLPTCQRCRRLRRKCDTQLPACRLCQKGKAECLFFDHALGQTLPRSYVHSLMTRLGRLKSVQSAVAGSKDPSQHFEEVRQSLTYSAVDPAIQNWGDGLPSVSYDKHFFVENANPTCWQFFGSSSAYSLAVEVLVHARTKFGPITSTQQYPGDEFALNTHPTENLPLHVAGQPASRQEIELLVAFYMATNNCLTAYIDVEMVAQDIEAYFALQGVNARTLTGQQAHQYFRLSMVCATAAANKARHQPKYRAESLEYYADALQCVEEVTSDVSPGALVALLLLVNFALFYPRKGDLWKLLDFACRLSVELNYYTEPTDIFEDEFAKKRRRSIFWGLYCVERTIGQQFGRPSDLTEEIITAEYPAGLAASTPTDSSEYQLLFTSHYYRLCYLRSEIFRDLYMPARAPDFPRFWYEQQFSSLLAWKQELEFVDNIVGMGSMTCEVGYQASICFLFQPLLLRTLVATNNSTISPESAAESIPLESYYSAVRVIDFYSQVFRAPDHTPYGMYPVTIVSAHYIYSGAMTLLAHVLLTLDGRLPVRSYLPSQTNEPQSQNQISIDFSGFHQISANCIFSLSRAAELFPGTVGMLDIYRKLADRVLPAMAKAGLG